jgi:hypothetical protein
MSDNEGSNLENGVTSGVDAQAKPKKKRIMKEDNYDIDDDFVDDSEMLWEAQAAASRDGFFVYSGPLVPEVEKPERYVFVCYTQEYSLTTRQARVAQTWTREQRRSHGHPRWCHARRRFIRWHWPRWWPWVSWWHNYS